MQEKFFYAQVKARKICVKKICERKKEKRVHRRETIRAFPAKVEADARPRQFAQQNIRGKEREAWEKISSKPDAKRGFSCYTVRRRRTSGYPLRPEGCSP
jgi:hypothetical protein